MVSTTVLFFLYFGDKTIAPLWFWLSLCDQKCPVRPLVLKTDVTLTTNAAIDQS